MPGLEPGAPQPSETSRGTLANDLYRELGVAKSASTEEIRKAYRALAQKYHPDRNPDDKNAEARFKRVNQAFHVLTDDKKRKLYDEFGEEGLREGFNAGAARAYRGRPGGGVNFEDIFSGAARGGAAGGAAGGFGDLFGDLFGGTRRGRARRSPDVQSEITIEFVSAVRGASLDLSVAGGRKVTVRIPAGTDDGDKLRVPGAGPSAGPGMPSGDLVLTVRVKRHPYFDRDGLDLTLDLPVSIDEAYSGSKVEVPTPYGSVQLKVPAHSQSGQLLRLRGKGVKRGDKTGDLYVRFLIHVPAEESEAIQSAVRTLADATKKDLRADITF